MKVFIKKGFLKRFLIENNLTQKELSNQLGISEMHLSFLINQKISPSVKTRRIFIDRIGKGFRDIFFYK